MTYQELYDILLKNNEGKLVIPEEKFIRMNTAYYNGELLPLNMIAERANLSRIDQIYIRSHIKNNKYEFNQLVSNKLKLKFVPFEDNIYIIKTYNKKGGSIFKIGYSSNIVNRLKNYFYYNPLVELVSTYYIENAKKIEKDIHKEFKSKILKEWYDEKTINKIIDKLNNIK